VSKKTPDSISYGAGTFNPYAAVAGIAVAAVQRIARGNQPREYRIGKQRVSARDFVRMIPASFPLQKWMLAPGARRDVRAGNVVQGSGRPAVAPPTATKPSDPGYRPDLTERKIPPLKRDPAPQRPPTSPDAMKVPPMGNKRTIALVQKWLARFGWGTFAIATLDSAIYLWNKYFPGQPLPTKEPPPSAAPGSQGGKGTSRPQLPPEIIVNVPPPNVSVVVNVPAPAPTPAPKPAPKPAPAPKSPVLPAPKPAPTIAKSPYPSWLPTAAGLALPFLLPQTQKRSKPRGLTGGSLPAVQWDTGVASVPFSSVGANFDSGPSPSQTKDCRCPSKRKRTPKKKRTVCYSGTYVEKSSGLRKTKRRKIPCL
jgi:hypothetical protein